YAGSLLLPHHELLVAGQRARGCGDGDKAGGGTVRNNRRDQGPRQHGEGGRRAVKADTGRASQVGPQNPGGPPDPAEVGLCFHERAQAYRDLVDRTFVAGSERIRRPVEAPIGGLDHTLVDVKLCATAMRAKAVKRVEGASQGHLKDCGLAVGATTGCAVQVPIGGLYQRPERLFAVRATALGAEAVKRRHRPAGGHLEYHSTAPGPTDGCCPVEVPIAGLDQARVRGRAVGAAALRAKVVKRGQLAPWSDFEDRAIVASSAPLRRPVEVPVRSLHQRSQEIAAICAVEAVQPGKGATQSDSENRPTVGGSAIDRGPVEVAIGGLDQRLTRGFAVCAAALGAKVIQRGQLATEGDFEDCPTLAVGPAAVHWPVEVPVGCLDQRRAGKIAVGT